MGSVVCPRRGGDVVIVVSPAKKRDGGGVALFYAIEVVGSSDGLALSLAIKVYYKIVRFHWF